MSVVCLRLSVLLSVALVPLVATPASFPVTMASACENVENVVNLADLFANSRFEDDLAHSHWTSTYKSTNYVVTSTVVNPFIVQKGHGAPLEAPDGDNFVGVLNPFDGNVNGRLVHDAVEGVFPRGTTFEITICANRGRLPDSPRADFEAKPSTVTLQFFGFRDGAYPVMNPGSDNWSRTAAMKVSRSFANRAPNGQWAAQTFSFTAHH